MGIASVGEGLFFCFQIELKENIFWIGVFLLSRSEQFLKLSAIKWKTFG